MSQHMKSSIRIQRIIAGGLECNFVSTPTVPVGPCSLSVRLSDAVSFNCRKSQQLECGCNSSAKFGIVIAKINHRSISNYARYKICGTCRSVVHRCLVLVYFNSGACWFA
jgi:hypothetical protein